ncbi:mechanosensitive ion channel [Ramlibacter tataouinensis]|uniref:mechanosensitive ion channel family protein n=1 Tax=Ramlibacter tataouinensis TaxID=94132 RepID=UPI0022F3B403|nr:mechanosensitive ion channel domain-containing protein [Ramlibacter tataouinensis]WBY01368.1 mechanosensitive ion channel [Ramlibacter tataouinensis]
MNPLRRLILSLDHPGLPVEAGVLLGCLLLAAGLSWWMGRGRHPGSVWFGRIVVDGLLFPLLALALVTTARAILDDYLPLALLRLAVPVLLSLAGIRFIARVLTVAFPNSGLARLVERVFSWLAWIAAALWVAGVLPAVMAQLDAFQFAFGKSRVSVLTLLEGLLWAGVVLVGALWASAVLERRVLQPAVQDLSLRKVAANAIRSVLLLVALLFALSATGIDLTALSVLGGALGVGLGFGLQKLASNYISGFVILFERSLRIGDLVKVDNFEGRVLDIKTRYTRIRAANGREAFVPNEKLIIERTENLSAADPKVMVTTDVTVVADSDVERVQQVLVAAARSVPLVMSDPPPAARLGRFLPNGLEFTVQFWIPDASTLQLNVRSDVNLAVLKGLRESGIELVRG